VPVKILGEELVLFAILAARSFYSAPTARTGARRWSTGSFKAKASAALITAGATTGAAKLSTGPPSRSRPRPIFAIPGIPSRSWAGWIFAHLGKPPAPPLPRYDVLVQDGTG
jgi:hypothetical protein